MPSDEKTESRIEKSEVEHRCGKRARVQSKDDLVLDETSKLIICLDLDI